MITESHLKKIHAISCKEYAKKFGLSKGQLNPHHSNKMNGSGNPRFGVVPSPETKRKISVRHIKSGRFKEYRKSNVRKNTYTDGEKKNK